MSSVDLVPGEQIVLRATLRPDKWKCYRCLTCSCRCAGSIYGALAVPFYWLCGGTCRQKEFDSIELVLTNQNIHFRQMLYDCGCCCQKSEVKIIPLEKIQDVALVGDCCGDCCNIVDSPGDVYQIHVQTAAMGGMIPELSAFCLENPREFKQQVLAAKNRIVTDTNIVGQSKAIDVQQLLLTANAQQQQELSRVLELLSRQLEEKKGTTS